MRAGCPGGACEPRFRTARLARRGRAPGAVPARSGRARPAGRRGPQGPVLRGGIERPGPCTRRPGSAPRRLHRRRISTAFVTSDPVHGEQSFLDTCRSFGAYCMLATQSVSSLEHALAHGGGGSDGNASAVSILWNNCASKLFFRSTDVRTMQRLDELCPFQPGLAAVTRVRPVSTLAPGECLCGACRWPVRAAPARTVPARRPRTGQGDVQIPLATTARHAAPALTRRLRRSRVRGGLTASRTDHRGPKHGYRPDAATLRPERSPAQHDLPRHAPLGSPARRPTG